MQTYSVSETIILISYVMNILDKSSYNKRQMNLEIKFKMEKYEVERKYYDSGDIRLNPHVLMTHSLAF